MHRALPIALALLVACPADDEDADDSSADTDSASTTASTTDGTTASTSASTTDGTTASTTTEDPTDATEDSGTTDDPTDAETSADSGTTGSGDLCAAAPEDEPCATCAKSMCCDAYAACYGDPDCVCAVECILESGDYQTCLGPKCNMPDAGPAMDIGICYGTTCAADCGLG